MKKNNSNWKSIIVSILATSLFWCGIYAAVIVPNHMKDLKEIQSTSSVAGSSSDEVVEETVFSYVTDIKEATFDAGNKEVTLHTPEGFFSVTDQYLESLQNYYGVYNFVPESLFVVGSSSSAYASQVMITASTLSTADALLKEAMKEDYNQEANLKSDTLVYIETGELPAELPDDYYLCELNSVTNEGVTYRVFDKYYTSSYTTYAEEDVAQTSPIVNEVPVHEFAAYSDTEDVIEIIVFEAEYDVNSAYTYFCEFIGAESGEPGNGTVITGNAPTYETDVTNDEVKENAEEVNNG